MVYSFFARDASEVVEEKPTGMGGLCQEGHDFLRLCKKRNKGATLRLLDVLVTQHAKWTARRIRRALFGQSLVDFQVVVGLVSRYINQRQMSQNRRK